MTSSATRHIHLYHGPLAGFDAEDPKLSNWPAVYILNDARHAYVGESLNVLNRFAQHQKSKEKQHLDSAHVVIDSRFNKSAALDLESHLVRLLAGDGQFEVLNRNVGIVNADYFDRKSYRKRFEKIFEDFHSLGIFTRPINEIENSELFKLSPFKALNTDQEQTIQSFLSDLLASLSAGQTSLSVIQGEPGTGKTIVGIYLLKLIRDLGDPASFEEPGEDTVFADPYVVKHRDLLTDFRVGLVIPQQALRESIKRVFDKTPALDRAMVLTPFDVGKADKKFDLLVVDETHRLNMRANQTSAAKNTEFREINRRLFGADDLTKTQLDWIEKQSRHQVFLLDAGQSVRPADLPAEILEALTDRAEANKRFYPLESQMRVRGGTGYIDYIRAIFSDTPPEPQQFDNYELRWFDDLREMERSLREKERRGGLARMIAGYAWPWRSKKDKSAFDIELDGVRRRWNTTEKDWVQSKKAIDEVGSIHTIQGYDLNYAGVIIGNDLRYDPAEKRFYVDLENYFDKKGKENNARLGIEYTADDILRYVINIYVVLLTRGIRGTFVYVCDPGLREYMAAFVRPAGQPSD